MESRLGPIIVVALLIGAMSQWVSADASIERDIVYVYV
jgi:hypothetical protein